MRAAPADSTAVAAELGLVAGLLADVLRHLSVVHEQVTGWDRDSIRNLRWHVAEAKRLNRHLHHQFDDRLTGPTPEQRSQPTSLHDPPNGPSGKSPPEDTDTPP